MASNAMAIENSEVGVAIQGDGNNTNIYGDIYVNRDAPSQDHFNLPSPIDTFTGRDEELEKMASLFFNENEKKIRRKVVICGFGGIGKSELAKKFAKICQDGGKIQKTYWIHAEVEGQLTKSATKITKIFVEMKGTKCLFILDNGISRQMLTRCGFNLQNDFFYIITSQLKEWGPDIVSIELGSLDLEEALGVYKSYLKDEYMDEDRDLFKNLAIFVGCIPLGLQITAAYAHLAKRMYGKRFLLEYVKELEDSQNKIIDKKFPASANNSYDNTIYKAITLSLSKVAIFDEDFNCPEFILRTVYICSFLDPEGIELNTILNLLNNVEDEKKTGENNDLRRVLFILDNLSLLTYNPDEPRIKMHRFVQEVLRYHLRIHDLEMQKHCYVACLKCCVSDFYNYSSVLQYADENITAFNYFYNTLYKNKVKHWIGYNSVFVDMCKEFVLHGCINTMDTILEDIGDSAEEYINNYDLFNYAAFSCNKENILECFLKYVHVNVKDIMYNDTPLHAAASSWNLTAIQFLLDHGADINSRNKEGNTPLFEFFRGVSNDKIINFEEVEKVFLLFKLNDNINFTNNEGKTYLHAVSNADLAEYLITKYHVNVNAQDSQQRTPLHTVLYESESDYLFYGELIKVLIIHGALLNIKDCNGTTPIALAQQEGIVLDLIELFFEDRFTEQLRKVFNELGDHNVINIINKFKFLHRVIKRNQTDVLNLLLEYGIDVNIRNFELRTPLHTAMAYWNLDVIKILIRYGANLRPRCYFDYTPLHHFFNGALFREHINLDEVNEILELLQYECDDNENAMTKYKQTLLHVAAMSCHADLVDLLAGKYKLNVNALNFEGDTPLHCLIEVQSKGRHSDYVSILTGQLLKEIGAGYKHRGHSSKECDVIDTVQKLKAHGARLDIINKKGLTPFDFATQEKVEFLLPYLIEKRRKHRKCKCIIL